MSELIWDGKKTIIKKWKTKETKEEIKDIKDPEKLKELVDTTNVD